MLKPREPKLEKLRDGSYCENAPLPKVRLPENRAPERTELRDPNPVNREPEKCALPRLVSPNDRLSKLESACDAEIDEPLNEREFAEKERPAPENLPTPDTGTRP